mmetsp:Transcript_168894/g.542904  ORF Transcript_168894/g.542904 Transcript_168894/m.542904 type:complete len:203 (-) Transcript_168894:2017-2625(-)
MVQTKALEAQPNSNASDHGSNEIRCENILGPAVLPRCSRSEGGEWRPGLTKEKPICSDRCSWSHASSSCRPNLKVWTSPETKMPLAQTPQFVRVDWRPRFSKPIGRSCGPCLARRASPPRSSEWTPGQQHRSSRRCGRHAQRQAQGSARRQHRRRPGVRKKWNPRGSRPWRVPRAPEVGALLARHADLAAAARGRVDGWTCA